MLRTLRPSSNPCSIRGSFGTERWQSAVRRGGRAKLLLSRGARSAPIAGLKFFLKRFEVHPESPRRPLLAAQQELRPSASSPCGSTAVRIRVKTNNRTACAVPLRRGGISATAAQQELRPPGTPLCPAATTASAVPSAAREGWEASALWFRPTAGRPISLPAELGGNGPHRRQTGRSIERRGG